MPVWHEKTRPLVEAGKLTVVGVVQEQHPRRAALFMQWKQMDWPILVDSFNLLDVAVVPITVLIDEHGIVRKVAARPDDLDDFLIARFEPAPASGATRVALDPDGLASLPFRETTALDTAIKSMQNVAAEDGRQHFRRGVALRMRSESQARQPGDFAAAIRAWEEALQQNPNQYIWRRRIQQYGPRLDKPYPFYDWVAQAQEEISKRGEEPVALEVSLSVAEIAQPADRDKGAAAASRHPDPTGQVQRDDHQVRVESAVVRSTDRRSPTARVHLELQIRATNSDAAAATHWNDDGGPIAFAADTGQSLRVGPIAITSAADSNGRAMEFEVAAQQKGALPQHLKGAVFYHLCIGEEQQCVYLRQDLTLRLGQ